MKGPEYVEYQEEQAPSRMRGYLYLRLLDRYLLLGMAGIGLYLSFFVVEGYEYISGILLFCWILVSTVLAYYQLN